MQVKVFSAAGTLLKTIGKAGGRARSGEWAKLRTDLYDPTTPAVAADGTLYVGEDAAPKRVAIFRHDRLADEWIGPLASGCGQMDIADEAQPEYIYQTYYPLEAIVRYRVDYAKQTQALDAVWELAHPAQPCPVYHLGGGGGGFIRHFHGHTYLYRNSMPLSIFRVEGYQLIPAGRIDLSVSGALDTVSAGWASRPGKPVLLPSGFRLQPQTVHDANGDGNIDENEVDWSLPPDFPRDMSAVAAYHPYIAPDLTFFGNGWKLPCLGLDTRGNPIYSWSKAVKLPTRPMGALADPQTAWWLNGPANKVGYDADGDIAPGQPTGREISTWVDPAGNYYFAADIEGKGKGIGWAASGIFARIGKLGQDGQWRWEAGDKATGFAKPGQFYKPGCFTGLVKGCIALTDWNGQMRLFDAQTGLYVGSLFADGYRGVAPDENLISVEYTEGHIFTHPQTGQVYALAGDGEALKLYHVTGLDTLVRFQGTVQLPAGTGATQAVTAPETATKGWDLAELPDVSQTNLSRVFFLDAAHGWICSAYGKSGPLHTTDGGKSWTVSAFSVDTSDTPEGIEPLPSPYEKYEQHGLWFIDAKTGWLGGTRAGEGFVAKTLDGGVTWQPLPWPKNTTVKTLWFANARQGWVAPFWGEPWLRRTDDGGQTWRVIDLTPVLTGMVTNIRYWEHRDFHAFDMQHLLVVGGEGLALRTADGGQSWQVSRIMPAAGAQDFDAVSFADAKHGLAVGTHGITAATADGGVTWTVTRTGLANNLTSVAMTSPTEACACGMTIYKGAPSSPCPAACCTPSTAAKAGKTSARSPRA